MTEPIVRKNFKYFLRKYTEFINEGFRPNLKSVSGFPGKKNINLFTF